MENVEELCDFINTIHEIDDYLNSDHTDPFIIESIGIEKLLMRINWNYRMSKKRNYEIGVDYSGAFSNWYVAYKENNKMVGYRQFRDEEDAKYTAKKFIKTGKIPDRFEYMIF